MENSEGIDLIAKAEELNIPKYMHGGLIRWVMDGIKPGNFLCAVISNDLRRAIEKADDANIGLLANYVRWFYHYTPWDCWGSSEELKNWRGLAHKDDKELSHTAVLYEDKE